jgi:hypothetical protein
MRFHGARPVIIEIESLHPPSHQTLQLWRLLLATLGINHAHHGSVRAEVHHQAPF